MPTKPNATALMVLAICASQPLAAQNVTADIARISAILQQEGFKAKREGEPANPRIETAMNGYDAAVFFYGCDTKGEGCKSVQFYAGFDPKKSPTLEAMNQYARENRWGRIYLDKDNDPVIEMDVDLEAGGMSEDLFIDNLAYWSTILGNFGTFVFMDE